MPSGKKPTNVLEEKKILSVFTNIFTHLKYFTLIHYIFLLGNKNRVIIK